MAKQSFRKKLNEDGIIVAVGAHNGLGAILAQRTGLDAIWASSFEISASHGYPDASILSMTDYLNAARNMAEVVDIPIIADCDNGYGNAINVMRTVRAFESAGIAGISIEDNVFPKRCSLYSGVNRSIESIEEFTGKIKAAKDAQRTSDFVVIARTEAAIQGLPVEEVCERARKYHQAGADMLFIHSKAPDTKQLKSIMDNLDFKAHHVCVPTIYKYATVEELEKLGFKMVIFANFAIRSAIRAMTTAFSILKEKKYAQSVDHLVASLEEVQDIVSVKEMKENEKKYLPSAGKEYQFDAK